MSYQDFISLFPDYRELSDSDPEGGLRHESREKGSYLCRAGDPLTRLFFITKGRARVFVPLSDGKSFLLRIYQPGDLVGDLEFFLGGDATCSIQCTTTVDLFSFSLVAVRQSPQRYNRAVMAMGTSIAAKLKENSLSTAVTTSYPVAARLAAYFLTHRDRDLRARTLQELAEWLGTSYRHLTRSLWSLCEAGALQKVDGTYEIFDEALLSRLAAEVLDEVPRRFV